MSTTSSILGLALCFLPGFNTAEVCVHAASNSYEGGRLGYRQDQPNLGVEVNTVIMRALFMKKGGYTTLPDL